jgi:hypothetical protein
MESDGILLLNWLRLLGWVVAVRPGAEAWVGVAQHEDAIAGRLRVEATAATHGELAWLLFSGALRRLDDDSTLRAA